TMRKALLASVSVIALNSSLVMAADLPVKAPPMPAVLPPWTGFYIGLNAGFAWGRSDPTLTGNPNAAPLSLGAPINPTPHLKPNGFIGGGQVGYNWQSGQWVFGAEIDFS